MRIKNTCFCFVFDKPWSEASSFLRDFTPPGVFSFSTFFYSPPPFSLILVIPTLSVLSGSSNQFHAQRPPGQAVIGGFFASPRSYLSMKNAPTPSPRAHQHGTRSRLVAPCMYARMHDCCSSCLLLSFIDKQQLIMDECAGMLTTPHHTCS